MTKDRCPGKMANTSGKRAARCALCGRLDYEANEGDVCGAPLKSGGTARSSKETKLDEAEWVVYKTHRKDALRWDSKALMSLDKDTMLLIFPKGFEVPADPQRLLVWRGSAKTSTDGLGIAAYHMRNSPPLKEAVATLRSLFEAQGPDEPETMSDKELRSRVVRYLNSSHGPSLKDVRRFGMWMDELMARTGKTWEELVKELGPQESVAALDALAQRKRD